jgi:hypothetical protein
MSKLSDLLKSQVGTANPANPANPQDSNQEISSFSNTSSVVTSKSKIPDDLHVRIRTMAARWGYSPEELTEALAGAQSYPQSWLAWTDRDEKHFGDCVTPAEFAARYAQLRGLT